MHICLHNLNGFSLLNIRNFMEEAEETVELTMLRGCHCVDSLTPSPIRALLKALLVLKLATQTEVEPPEPYNSKAYAVMGCALTAFAIALKSALLLICKIIDEMNNS